MLLKVLEIKPRDMTSYYLKKPTLLRPFQRGTERCSNMNKLHYFIRPILLGPSTSKENLTNAKAKTKGQELEG